MKLLYNMTQYNNNQHNCASEASAIFFCLFVVLEENRAYGEDLFHRRATDMRL